MESNISWLIFIKIYFKIERRLCCVEFQKKCYLMGVNQIFWIVIYLLILSKKIFNFLRIWLIVSSYFALNVLIGFNSTLKYLKCFSKMQALMNCLLLWFVLTTLKVTFLICEPALFKSDRDMTLLGYQFNFELTLHYS